MENGAPASVSANRICLFSALEFPLNHGTIYFIIYNLKHAQLLIQAGTKTCFCCRVFGSYSGFHEWLKLVQILLFAVAHCKFYYILAFSEPQLSDSYCLFSLRSAEFIFIGIYSQIQLYPSFTLYIHVVLFINVQYNSYYAWNDIH